MRRNAPVAHYPEKLKIMADILKLKPHILKWEGGFCNVPGDRGGATNMGVTIATFRRYYGANKTVADLKAITDEQWSWIFADGFWNPCKGDYIKNQSLANLIVDFAFNSGTANAIKRVQAAIGVTPDGIVGNITLGTLNGDLKGCFDRIWKVRKSYYIEIARKPTKAKFLKGWLNRLNDLQFQA